MYNRGNRMAQDPINEKKVNTAPVAPNFTGVATGSRVPG